MRLARFSGRFYVSAALFLVIVVFGFLGPYLISNTPSSVAGGLYDSPSKVAWLGTDYVGHDVFANLVYGTRTSLIVGLLAGATATLLGVAIGTAAGYFGGFLEESLMAFTNIIVAIPTYVVLILIAIALNSRSATGVAIVIAVTTWPWTARAVRAQASSVRTREHLDIARLSGAGGFGLIIFDVIPYMLSYIVMAFVLQVASAILTEAALSLLGLGPSNGVSLGIMLHWALASEAVRTGAWWAFVPPTVLLTLIAFSLLMLQSSLDELFNPRLRRGAIKLRRGAAAPLPAVTAEAPTAASAGVSVSGLSVGVPLDGNGKVGVDRTLDEDGKQSTTRTATERTR
jgi:peptide/nickel transport system permease protein